MARTVITPISAPAPYATAGADLTWTGADVANGNRFISTGHEIVLVRNTDAGASHTATVQSSADPFGRTGNATKSVPANGVATFQELPCTGWQQADGYIYLNGDHANLQFAVVKLS